jgi:hypothetical protein
MVAAHRKMVDGGATIEYTEWNGLEEATNSPNIARTQADRAAEVPGASRAVLLRFAAAQTDRRASRAKRAEPRA